MKNKKLIVITLVLALLVAGMAWLWLESRQEAVQGAKSFSVTVVHQDGSEKSFEYRTDAEYLDEVLVAEGLIAGEEGPYGLTVITVDGEDAVWDTDNAYWAIYTDGEASLVGISEIPVTDGGSYKLEYTSLG